jgi:hypothetical protein
MKPIAVAAILAAVLSAADGDAQRIYENLQARHRPYGQLMDPVFATPESEKVIGYSRCGDAAIWTGHLLAAESFRYRANPSVESLEAVKRTLEVIRQLIDVTGKDLLARCAFPANSPHALWILSEEAHHGFYAGTVNGEQWLWIGNTSRDQYLGVFFGLTAAWNLVDDVNVRGGVGWLAKRLLDNLTRHGWTVVMPDGRLSTTFAHRADQQLALLKLGARVGSRTYSNSYKSLALFSSAAITATMAVEGSEPHDSYFKFNLDYITFYCLLSDGDSGWVRGNYRRAFEILREATESHENAFFRAISRSLDEPAGEVEPLLEQWLERPVRDFYVDVRGQFTPCGENRSCEVIPIAQRVTTDFLWQRSPFQMEGGGSGRMESSGLDYLLPYWMERARLVAP